MTPSEWNRSSKSKFYRVSHKIPKIHKLYLLFSSADLLPSGDDSFASISSIRTKEKHTKLQFYPEPSLDGYFRVVVVTTPNPSNFFVRVPSIILYPSLFCIIERMLSLFLSNILSIDSSVRRRKEIQQYDDNATRTMQPKPKSFVYRWYRGEPILCGTVGRWILV